MPNKQTPKPYYHRMKRTRFHAVFTALGGGRWAVGGVEGELLLKLLQLHQQVINITNITES